MVKFDGDKVDDDQVFKVIPEGNYKLLIDKITPSVTKKGDEMWKIKFVVASGKHQWSTIYDNIVWSANEHAMIRAKQFLKCFRVYADDKDDYSLFELESKTALVNVVIGKTNKGKDRNEIPFEGYYTYKDDVADEAVPPSTPEGNDVPF